MILEELALSHFRSHTKRTFAFDSHVTVLFGPNAVGKTNVLEAVSTLATGKSFRAEKDSEMVETKHELGRIKGQIQLKDEKQQLEVVVTTGSVAGQPAPLKRYFINGVPKRLVDFIGKLKAVLFWPEDLELVTGSPSQRRNYLNFVLVQTDWEYRRSLLSYEKGVRQRNRLLEQIREGQAERSHLIFWDQLLIKNGEFITKSREEFIEYINHTQKRFGNFHIQYDPSLISPARLAQYKDAEVAAAATLVGPHRDDLFFFEGERNLAKFGSRGEQRLVVLWLKLAELGFMLDKTQDKPVLLLDDIFSELDDIHREEVVKLIGEQQTIITSADIHALPSEYRSRTKVIELR